MPDTKLVGMDINPKMIEFGKEKYGLDLIACNETALAGVPDNSYDVVFTISVLDHIPYPEYTLRQLLRVTKDYLILFEISGSRVGKTIDVIMTDDTSDKETKSYPYSYLHDYRAECERKFGALCVADVQFPIQSGNMSDLYRMFVFSPRVNLLDQQLVTAVSLKPIS